jgi:hypothetical protein
VLLQTNSSAFHYHIPRAILVATFAFTVCNVCDVLVMFDIHSHRQLIVRDSALGLGTLAGYYAFLFLVHLVQRNAASTAQLALAWSVSPSSRPAESSTTTSGPDSYFIGLCVINTLAWTSSMFLRVYYDLESFSAVFLLSLVSTTVFALLMSWYSTYRTLKHLKLGACVGGDAVLAALTPFHRFIAISSIFLLILAALQLYSAIKFIRDWSSFQYFARELVWSDLAFGIVSVVCAFVAMLYSQLTRPLGSNATPLMGSSLVNDPNPSSPFLPNTRSPVRGKMSMQRSYGTPSPAPPMQDFGYVSYQPVA